MKTQSLSGSPADARFVVALGGNLPFDGRPPGDTLRAALDFLDESGFALDAVSGFYSNPAFPRGSGPDFVNAVASFVSDLAPGEVLARLHAAERRFGRERDLRWGPRTLDLDLVAAGDAVLPDGEAWARWAGLAPDRRGTEAPEGLILPHPRLAERAFVLIPMHDILPAWRHPATGASVAQMLDALPPADIAELRRLP
ncbi:2-amino-4-hydroxy-6-hydroxymethyldihydropteridine diphosphokinase [Palleronia sediminis]|uniref:2-amino-4-hydroxy-6-hydroxymethyldihydropteridine pyrophosphokinase n=1 Tax=Palleronia sediminis TaxID=2547833 RepID=A0A4R6A1X3_9RHOB|nr:2-amino-4-hydroxy-6-hydroxymethyldihydropteridine diphosphokinase [Palleronia sediminis]TDL75006.1 2-amino-4-hydroxy-6-hydroxymethyldihydropteridine diphosphokinase [Palleronia sediminis]